MKGKLTMKTVGMLKRHHVGKAQVLTAILILYGMVFIPMSLLTIKFPTFLGGYADCASICLSFVPMLIGDVLVECYGYKKAIKIGALAYIFQLFISAIIAITVALPGVDEYVNECYAVVLGTNWRYVVFGMIAYYVGMVTNNGVMGLLGNRWKKGNTDNGFKLFVRAIGSTILGQLLDNFVFAFFAFAPWGWTEVELPYDQIFAYIGVVTAFEVGLECVLYPLTKFNVGVINALPQTYDGRGNAVDFEGEAQL